METIFKSISDTADTLGIKRTKTYELLSSGELESDHIGRRRLVLVSSIRAFADKQRTKPTRFLGSV